MSPWSHPLKVNQHVAGEHSGSANYSQALTTAIHTPVSWVMSTACSTVSRAEQISHSM